MRQDGTCDLLIVVPDRLVSVRQGPLHAIQLELGAVADRSARLVTAPVRGRKLATLLELGLDLASDGLRVHPLGLWAGGVQRHTQPIAVQRHRLRPQRAILQ